MTSSRRLLARTTTVLSCVSVLGGAAWLIAPAAAYTLTGTSLSPEAAHFRVFNNFADPEANDNTTEQSQFPGTVGAPLAIWKASVEWGTSLHGTGEGDPTQPGDLGSGGSNFSPSYQGAASSIGSVGDNVHSAISSLPGGVIAITELGAGGWRIRYNEALVWDDAPSGPAAGALDLQSVATREYGRALGLGNTSVPGCVMSTVSVGPTTRDLCPDDAAGLQAIYGAAAPGKPAIDAVLVDAGGSATLLGANFAGVGNEVWLTPATVGGPVPLKLTGVPATDGGTRIDVTLPPEAGAGDVLVRTPGSGWASLSNAWPIDAPGGVSCGTVVYGAGLGGANVAELDAANAPEVGGVLLLDLGAFPSDGIAITQIAGQAAALPLFGGTVLVDPATPIATLATTVTGGIGSQPVPIPASPTLAGARVFAQAGQPDAGSPAGIALSNGLEIVLCP